MTTPEELKEPTFGPIVTEPPKRDESEPLSGRKGGEAGGGENEPIGDVSASEEENESRLPGDPRDINEQQPPTKTEF